MRGLLKKIWWEVRWPILWFALGLAVIMGLLTILLPKVLGSVHTMFESLPLLKPLVTALLGVDPGDRISREVTQAFLWVHPTVLALVWAHELMYCSRLPAGEIDRGTADFLFCLPVSRWKLFVAESLGWLVTGIVILSAGYAGHLLASRFVQTDMRLNMRSTAYVLGNLFAIYLAVGSMAMVLSVLSDRRGRALGVMFGFLLVSFLLNFIAQFWDAAKGVSWLSLLEYYRPAVVIRDQAFPWTDVGILLAIAMLLWTAAGVIFARRSICTV